MSNIDGPEKRNFFDLSQYSSRTRKIIFGVIVGLLIAVVAVSMFIISPLVSENRAEPSDEPNPTATQGPVSPDGATPTPSSPPTANPDSAEEEAGQYQQDVIDQSNAVAEEQQDEVVEDFHPNLDNAEQLEATAVNGVLAYCQINAGESTADRQARMEPYFHAENSVFRSPAEFYYQRECSVEANTDAETDDAGAVNIYVGVAWSALLSEDTTSADTGYTQYHVIVDSNGIVSLYD